MTYETPTLTEVGSLDELTLGEGWEGNADGIWIFTWGS